MYLVMLKPMQQYVQVKGRYIVANYNIWVQCIEAAYEVAQQGTLAGLDRQHATPITAPQLTLVAVLHCLLKACNTSAFIFCSQTRHVVLAFIL